MNHKNLEKTLIELLEIDSPSKREDNIIKYIQKKLDKLKIKSQVDKHNNIFAKIQGKGKPILLNAHTDTVKSTKNLKIVKTKDKIKTDGNTILGGDDKAGIAIILELLKSLKDNPNKPSLEILFTASEEIGTVGADKFDYSKIKSKYGLSLDGDGSPSNIVHAAVGRIQFKGSFLGKESHACEPEKGISAMHASGFFISQFPFGKITEKTMANIGIIKGGEVVNALTEKVYLEGEIRSLDKKELNKYKKRIESLINATNSKFKTNDSFTFEEESSPFEVNKTSPFVKKIEEIMLNANLEPSIQKSMGGSDANCFNENKIETLILSPGYYNCHSKNEYINLKEFFLFGDFLEEFLLN